jgi:hypothetical protein
MIHLGRRARLFLSSWIVWTLREETLDGGSRDPHLRADPYDREWERVAADRPVEGRSV